MKTRMGFVSNSSSSSFVVAFPSKPDSEQKLRDMMFPPTMTEVQPYDSSSAIPVADIVKQVLKEIKAQGRTASQARIARYLHGWSWLEEYNMYGSDYDRDLKPEEFDTIEAYREARDKRYKEENERHAAIEEAKAEKFKERHKNAFILVTSYADEDGNFFSTMEHSWIFRNLEHIQISNH